MQTPKCCSAASININLVKVRIHYDITTKDGSTVRYVQNLRNTYLEPYRTGVPYFSSIFEAYRTNVPYPYLCKKAYRTSVQYFLAKLSCTVPYSRTELPSLILTTVLARGGVKDTRIEAKAKDTKNFQGQGQTFSRPRPRTKDTGASVLQKKEGFQKNFSSNLKKKVFKNFFLAIST